MFKFMQPTWNCPVAILLGVGGKKQELNQLQLSTEQWSKQIKRKWISLTGGQRATPQQTQAADGFFICLSLTKGSKVVWRLKLLGDRNLDQ